MSHDAVKADHKAALDAVLEDFDRRVKRLERFGGAIIALICLLVGGASCAIFFADSLTSNEVSTINRQVSVIAAERAKIYQELAPELLLIRRNCDAIDRRVRYLTRETTAGEFKSNPGRYTYYGELKPDYFTSKKAFKDFLETLKQLPTDMQAAKGDVIVMTFGVLLTGTRADDSLSANYFWALTKKSIPEIETAIDGASDIKEIDSEVASQISTSLDGELASVAKFKALQNLREEMKSGDEHAGYPAASSGAADQRAREVGSIGYYLLQLNLNKFGIMSLLVILIGIFTSLLKYNMRLAAFYLARADALRLAAVLPSIGFVRLSAALTPSIDFGKPEEVVAYAKDMLGGAGRENGKDGGKEGGKGDLKDAPTDAAAAS